MTCAKCSVSIAPKAPLTWRDAKSCDQLAVKSDYEPVKN